MNIRQPQAKAGHQLNTNEVNTGLTCLVTGFDPFNNHYSNPSAAVSQLMPDSLKLRQLQKKTPVKRLILSSSGEKAWIVLKEAIDKLPQDCPCPIVLLGQAGQRKVIGLERFALNIRDYRIKDNSGYIFAGDKIYQEAPEAIRTKAPIEESLKYLKEKGLPAEISNFCGTYVCNETYFRALHYLNEAKLPHLVSFVHLPLPRTYAKALIKTGNEKLLSLANSKDGQLQSMLMAVKYIVELNCNFLLQK